MNPANQTIIELLKAHRAMDDKEHADVEFIQTFAKEHAVVFGKSNPLGHITGSALVLDPSNRILLTFHGKLERWLQRVDTVIPTSWTRHRPR